MFGHISIIRLEKDNVLPSGNKFLFLYRTCRSYVACPYPLVLAHTCTDNYVIFHKYEYVDFMCVCTDDAGDVCNSSIQRIK